VGEVNDGTLPSAFFGLSIRNPKSSAIISNISY
jgi:hypothetical protein